MLTVISMSYSMFYQLTLSLAVSQTSLYLARRMNLRVKLLGIRIHHWMLGLLTLIVSFIAKSIFPFEMFVSVFFTGFQIFLDDLRDFISFIKQIFNMLHR